jgi:NAD(P)H dehydrogenase (quinone)
MSDLTPAMHGSLFFPGMQVLPTFAVYDAVRIDAARMDLIESAWQTRLQDLFDSAPIAFRTQNGGDYPDRHVLAEDVVPGLFGLDAHIKV